MSTQRTLLGLAAVVTVGLGWGVAVGIFGDGGADTSGTVALVVGAVVASIGLVLALTGLRLGADARAGAGLILVAAAPTGFAYIGNLLVLVAGVGFLIRALGGVITH